MKNGKKIISTLLALAMAIGLYAPAYAADCAHASYSNGFCVSCSAYQPAALANEWLDVNGDGVYGDAVYEIENAGQLFWFAEQINKVDRTLNARLKADIDLGGKAWTPIGATGEGNNNFRGVFDGCGHTIRGLNVTAGRNGAGFFGEVRTGTAKNFTIYGEVKVPAKYTYIGGAIGSACGVNEENDLERNGAIIQNITSYVNVTTTAHGIGRIGGFMGYANHETLVENCAWYGTLDLGAYRAEAGVGGFIGRIQENSNSTIRNCAAYGTVKTNYKKGTYNNNNDIFIGGFTGWSVQGSETRPTNTVLENCLFAGSFVLGKDITDMIDYSAFGCLSQIKSIANCYYLNENGLLGINNNSTYKPTGAELCAADKAVLASGQVAYGLGSKWGQTIGTDSAPVLGGEAVYKVRSCDGISYAYSNTNAAFEHVDADKNGACDVCGAKELTYTDIGGGISYAIDGATLYVKGEGTVGPFSSSTASPWYANRKDIKKVIISEGITDIGKYAFSNMTAVADVSFPSTLVTIGANSFYKCPLTSLALPASVELIDEWAFGNAKFTSVTVGGGVKSIGKYAFYYCTELKNATIGEGVQSIGDYAFDGCSALTTVSLPDSLEQAGEEVFRGTALISNTSGYTNGVLYVDNHLVAANSTVSAVTVKSGTKTIFGSAMEGTPVKSVVVPSSVVAIGTDAFRDCTSLASVTLNEGLKRVGNYAFYRCSALANVTYPTSVDYIGQNTLLNTAMYSSAGDMLYSGVHLVAVKTEYAYYDVREGTKTIAAAAFYNKGSDAKVTLPDSVEIINDYAFRGCSYMNINLPSGLRIIGEYAFDDCTGMGAVTVPASVEKIGANAFYRTKDKSKVLCYQGTYAEKYLVENDYQYTIILKEAGGEISDTVSWKLDEEGVLTISGSGAMADYEMASDAPWAQNSEYVLGVVVEDGITSVGDYAFAGLKNATALELGADVTDIGAYAFYNCGIDEISLPEGVVRVGKSAFDGSGYALDTANWTDGQLCIGHVLVATDGNAAVPDTVTCLADYLYAETDIYAFEVPGQITKIPDGLFSNCKSLKYVKLHNGVKEIGSYSFEDCVALEQLGIPYGVEIIKANAFFGSGLKSAVVPGSVHTIDRHAFGSCTSLEDVLIMQGVEAIGQYAFSSCSNLKYLSIPVTVKQPEYLGIIGETEVYYAAGVDMTTNNIGLFEPTQKEIVNSVYKDGGTITLYNDGEIRFNYSGIGYVPADLASELVKVLDAPDSIRYYCLGDDFNYVADGTFENCTNFMAFTCATTEVMANAFAGCSKLEYFENKLTYLIVGAQAFKDCKVFDMSEGISKITSVGDDAFVNTRLSANPLNFENGMMIIAGSLAKVDEAAREITIPSDVSDIHTSAFYGCDVLASITVADNNETFKAVDGVLFTKADNAIYRYPAAGAAEYVIPEGTAAVAPSAFAGCAALTKVTFPKGVDSVGENAFAGCDGLTICAYEDTAAHIYAVENGINFEAIAPEYETGDVNGDGKLNTRDVTTLRRYLAGGYEDSITVVAEMVDVNGDGRENTRDVAALRGIIAG